MDSAVIICDREDDDVVDGTVLDWAGLQDFWDEHYRVLSNHSVVRDILPMCSHVEIETEEWDADVPGRSGIYYTIQTVDEDSLRAELRERIEQLVCPVPPAAKTAVEDEVEGIRTRVELVDYLRTLAETLRRKRMPGGYGAFTQAYANAIDGAVVRIKTESPSRDAVREMLAGLAEVTHRMDSVSAPLRRLAARSSSLLVDLKEDPLA